MPILIYISCDSEEPTCPTKYQENAYIKPVVSEQECIYDGMYGVIKLNIFDINIVEIP